MLMDENHVHSETTTGKQATINICSAYQLAAKIPVGSKESTQNVLKNIIDTILDWISEQLPLPFPEGTRQKNIFNLSSFGQQDVHCCAIPEENIWTIQMYQLGQPGQGFEPAVGRTWTIDISLHPVVESILFGIRVGCVLSHYAKQTASLTLPKIVQIIINRYGLRDIRTIDEKPWYLNRKSELRQLYDFLINENRKLPVLVMTQRELIPGTIKGFTVNEKFLAKVLLGYVHVVCLPTSLEIPWMEKIGKHWSLIRNCIRIYLPNIDLQKNSPNDHPLLQYNSFDNDKEKEVLLFLTAKLKQYGATKNMFGGDWIFYTEARVRHALLERKRLDAERKQMISIEKVSELQDQFGHLESAYQEEIEALQNQLNEALEVKNDLIADYELRLEQMELEKRNLQYKNEIFRTAFSAKTEVNENAIIPIPNSFDEMFDWVEKHLLGRLILHNRVKHGIKTAVYENVPLVYEALLLLASSYRSMRLGEPKAKEEWELGRLRLGLEFDNSIRKERAAQEGDDYYVQYPPGKATHRFLEYHLKKGTARNDRYCLRIYFFWDENIKQIVVGWLPSHLNTRIT